MVDNRSELGGTFQPGPYIGAYDAERFLPTDPEDPITSATPPLEHGSERISGLGRLKVVLISAGVGVAIDLLLRLNPELSNSKILPDLVWDAGLVVCMATGGWLLSGFHGSRGNRRWNPW